MNKQDILDKIKYRNKEQNANITLDDDTLEIVLESYENRLDNTDE